MGSLGGTTKKEETTQSSQTQPWAPAQGVLGGILNQLHGALGSTGLTGAETGALDALSASARAGNPYAPAIGGLAGTLLAGGGPDRSGIASDAYGTLQSQLTPYASGGNLNPYDTPGFGDALATLGSDITGQINSQFAGAGRDMSGANQQALARGLAQGQGQLIADQYNRNVANQMAAANALYGAGGQTAGLLSGLDQTRLGNQVQGAGLSEAALNAQNYGPQQQLAIEAQRRGIPVSALAQLAGIATPIAGLGSSSTGTRTTESSTPFNPLALAPLALAPFTGGTSLAGMGMAGLGGGLFSGLSNGFLSGGFNRR